MIVHIHLNLSNIVRDCGCCQIASSISGNSINLSSTKTLHIPALIACDVHVHIKNFGFSSVMTINIFSVVSCCKHSVRVWYVRVFYNHCITMPIRFKSFNQFFCCVSCPTILFQIIFCTVNFYSHLNHLIRCMGNM